MAGALPELDFRGAFDPIANQNALAQFQQEQTLLPSQTRAKQAEYDEQAELAPIRVQNAKTENLLSNIRFGETALGAVAKRAAAADPDEAQQVWDDGMKTLASEGVPGAGQYVGRYSAPLAERVGDVYGSTKPETPPNFDAEGVARQIATLPPAQRASTLRNTTAVVSGYDRVKDEASWNDELAAIKSAGMDPSAFIQPGANWQMSYMAVRPMIQRMRAGLPILQGAVMQDQGGIPNAQPKPLYEPNSTYVGTNSEGKPIYHDPHSGVETVGNEPILPKPSAGVATFQYKLKIAQEAGMGEQEALQFANGKRSMDDGQMRLAAQNAASRELADLSLGGATIDNPQQWVQQRSNQIYQQIKGQNGSPAASGGTGKPSGGSKLSAADIQASLANARAALKAHPDKRAQILARLAAAGVPTKGL